MRTPPVAKWGPWLNFLMHKNIRPCEIHRQLKKVYGNNVMDESCVRRWCRNYLGRWNTHDEEYSGIPSVITHQLLGSVEECARKDRRVIIDEVCQRFPRVSWTIVHEIVKDHVHYTTIYARWILCMLPDEHKTKRMAAALMFLVLYSNERYSFLSHIITGDETRVCYASAEIKWQSVEWHHPHSPTTPIKFRQVWPPEPFSGIDEVVLLIDFVSRGDTINANSYCETLKKLRRAIQNRRRGLLPKGIILHDNARPHTAVITQQLLRNSSGKPSTIHHKARTWPLRTLATRI